MTLLYYNIILLLTGAGLAKIELVTEVKKYVTVHKNVRAKYLVFLGFDFDS